MQYGFVTIYVFYKFHMLEQEGWYFITDGKIINVQMCEICMMKKRL